MNNVMMEALAKVENRLDLSVPVTEMENRMSEELAGRVDLRAGTSVQKSILESYWAYASSGESGNEIILMRVRDIDGRQQLCPIGRVLPKYRLCMNVSRGELKVIHKRRERSFVFESLNLPEYSANSRMFKGSADVTWINVTDLHRQLMQRDCVAWEQIYERIVTQSRAADAQAPRA